MKRYTGEISEGTIYEHEFCYSQEEVNDFAEITGDKNPIHLDEAYASKSIFKKRIIHGFLGGSIFSKVFAMFFPGEGTIYLKQDMVFLKPMYANEVYKAVFEVLEKQEEKKRALIKTDILNDKGEVVLKGEALIQNNSLL